MRLRREHRRALLGGVLLLQVLFHLCSSTLFIHSHIIDGIEVIHSHIFAGPVTEHSHTTDSAESIERSTYYEAVVVATTATIATPTYRTVEASIYHAHSVAVTLITHHSLRAPPMVA